MARLICNMKKIILLIILLFPFGVLADTCNSSNISISNISLLEKSDNVNEVVDAIATDKNINIDLTMFQVGDNIKYKIELKNESNEDYEMDKNSLNSISDYFKYSLESEDDSNVIKANSNKTLYLNLEYINKVPEDVFISPVYNDINNIVVGLSTESTSSIQKILENPKTGVYSYAFLLFIIVPIGVISYILIKKKKYSKFMMILAIGSLVIPYVAFAKCKCELNIKSNIAISKREPFLYDYYYENGGVTIDYYLLNAAQTAVDYKLVDKNKCISYISNELSHVEPYDYDLDDWVPLYSLDEATYYASSVCSGASDKRNLTLENYILNMRESEYSEAGLSNVSLTSKGSDAGLDVIIPTYIDGKVVKKLGDRSFFYLGIRSVKLPDYLEELDGYDDVGAFSQNELKEIILPNTITRIGPLAFSDNQLETVVIPDSVKTIAYEAFRSNNISSLTLGNSVEFIGAEAFYYNNLTTVTIPASVKELWPGFVTINYWAGAFWGNPLRSVTILGKSSADEFVKYHDNIHSEISYPFGWASDVTCVKNNDTNVPNGCIIWEG